MSEPVIPPQEDLQREMAQRAARAAAAESKCPRCETPGQRFLRRCAKCGRRYRSFFADRPAGSDFPASWARRNN